MFFRRKTKENHAKSVQNVRKLVFSPRKTQGKDPPKKKGPKKNSTTGKRKEGGQRTSQAERTRKVDGHGKTAERHETEK